MVLGALWKMIGTVRGAEPYTRELHQIFASFSTFVWDLDAPWSGVATWSPALRESGQCGAGLSVAYVY